MRMILAALIVSIASPVFGQITEPHFNCGGAEPFWSLELTQTEGQFSTPETSIAYELALKTPADGRFWPVAYTLISDADTAIAIIGERSCSDTMSDQNFLYSIELLTQKHQQAIMLTGCCRRTAAQ